MGRDGPLHDTRGLGWNGVLGPNPPKPARCPALHSTSSSIIIHHHQQKPIILFFQTYTQIFFIFQNHQRTQIFFFHLIHLVINSCFSLSLQEGLIY